MRFSNCEFCEKWDFKIVNFVKNETLKMWILWKMKLWKCEFCKKWVSENVTFVKNETLKLWILWIMRFWKCDFCEKWDFQNVNFWINWGVLPQCAYSSAHVKWFVNHHKMSEKNFPFPLSKFPINSFFENFSPSLFPSSKDKNKHQER